MFNFHTPFTLFIWHSDPVHGGVYLMQHYVIKFVSDLWQIGDFLRVLWFPPPIELKYCIKHHKPTNINQPFIWSKYFHSELQPLNLNTKPCLWFQLFKFLIQWVSEWLLFNTNSAIFSAISWREQVNFQWNDYEVRFVLDQHP